MTLKGGDAVPHDRKRVARALCRHYLIVRLSGLRRFPTAPQRQGSRQNASSPHHSSSHRPLPFLEHGLSRAVHLPVL